MGSRSVVAERPGTCCSAWAHLKQRMDSWKMASVREAEPWGRGRLDHIGMGAAVIIHFLSTWTQGGEAATVRPSRHPGPVNPHRHKECSQRGSTHCLLTARTTASPYSHHHFAHFWPDKLCEGRESTYSKAVIVFALKHFFPPTLDTEWILLHNSADTTHLSV